MVRDGEEAENAGVTGTWHRTELNTVAKHFMTKAKYDTLFVVLGEF